MKEENMKDEAKEKIVVVQSVRYLVIEVPAPSPAAETASWQTLQQELYAKRRLAPEEGQTWQTQLQQAVGQLANQLVSQLTFAALQQLATGEEQRKAEAEQAKKAQMEADQQAATKAATAAAKAQQEREEEKARQQTTALAKAQVFQRWVTQESSEDEEDSADMEEDHKKARLPFQSPTLGPAQAPPDPSTMRAVATGTSSEYKQRHAVQDGKPRRRRQQRRELKRQQRRLRRAWPKGRLNGGRRRGMAVSGVGLQGPRTGVRAAGPL